MEYKAFSKTLLNIYNSLNAVCERIDEMVEKKALNGAFYASGSQFRNPMELCNNLIDMSQRKINLINLKLRIESAITKLKQKEAKVLILKFVDRLTFSQIASLTNQCLRNCFRICENGIENFGKILKEEGLTEEKIFKNYADEKWIFQVYDFFCVEKESEAQKSEKLTKAPALTKKDIVKIASKRVFCLGE